MQPDMSDSVQNNTEPAVKRLQLLMRLFGCICVVAFLPFVMPVAWMDWCHRQLDLGVFPIDKPIAVYLARSTSALCGLYGAFALILATDVIKYQKLILFHIAGLFSIGTIGTFLAYQCGMPIFWVLTDFISILIICPLKYCYYKRMVAWKMGAAFLIHQKTPWLKTRLGTWVRFPL